MFLLQRSIVEGKSSHQIGEELKQMLRRAPASVEVVKLAPCAKRIISKKRRAVFLAEVAAVAFA